MIPFLFVLLMADATPTDGDGSAHDRYQRFSRQALAGYDPAQRAFVTRSGAPVESAVELGLSGHAGNEDWHNRAISTVIWTHGLLDTLTGGFVYASDPRNADVEFGDKRADANGRRLENLIQAWQATGEERYRRDATRLVDWIERILVDGRGGFITAQVGDRELVPTANGYAIHAWLVWAAATRSPRHRDFALRSLDRVWEKCWMPSFGLMRKDNFGDVVSPPQLTDQVEMGRAFVLAARLGNRASDHERAVQLADLMIERYEDKEKGGFRGQSVPKKDGSIRKSSRPWAENARAALFLAELAALTGQSAYRDAAARAALAFRKDWHEMGAESADWALAARAEFAPDLPKAPEWLVEAREPEVPRRRSLRIKSGK